MIAELRSSPLAPDRSPVRVFYREHGGGNPLIFLHGGWGYQIYPFDRQIAALATRWRIVIPDRTGYGRSEPIDAQQPGFHQCAAAETLALIDVLGIDRPILWGHSDGAVIALLFGLFWPDRVGAIVAEATHFFRVKPASKEFFETMMREPLKLGGRVTSVLERDHGARWPAVISMNGSAWLRIAAESPAPDSDLYDGRLPSLAVPTLLVHGAQDPRTEPTELDRLVAALGATRNGSLTRNAVLAQGGHSPHSETAVMDEVTAAAIDFLAPIADQKAPSSVSRIS